MQYHGSVSAETKGFGDNGVEKDGRSGRLGTGVLRHQ